MAAINRNLEYIIPRELDSKTQIKASLTLSDFLFMAAVLMSSFLVKDLVHPSLFLFYLGFIFLVDVILIIPAGSQNPKKRFYHKVIFVVLKNRRTINSIADPLEVNNDNEETSDAENSAADQ